MMMISKFIRRLVLPIIHRKELRRLEDKLSEHFKKIDALGEKLRSNEGAHYDVLHGVLLDQLLDANRIEIRIKQLRGLI